MHNQKKDSIRNDQTEEFLCCLSASYQDIYQYILTLVMDTHATEDIFQEVNLVLWKKFDTFERGTNFRGWALKIALNQILAWRKRVVRNRLVFNEEILALVAEKFEKENSTVQDQKESLAECIETLSSRHRQLLSDRYDKNLSNKEISVRTGKSVEGIRRTLSRIRKILFDCSHKKMFER